MKKSTISISVLFSLILLAAVASAADVTAVVFRDAELEAEVVHDFVEGHDLHQVVHIEIGRREDSALRGGAS